MKSWLDWSTGIQKEAAWRTGLIELRQDPGVAISMAALGCLHMPYPPMRESMAKTEERPLPARRLARNRRS